VQIFPQSAAAILRTPLDFAPRRRIRLAILRILVIRLWWLCVHRRGRLSGGNQELTTTATAIDPRLCGVWTV
jgi:hypothetical protein